MSRRPSRRAVGGMSLFPFLAVLICTMGALVGLLMLMVASAQAHAASARVELDRDETPPPAAPAIVDAPSDEEASRAASVALEDAQWRRDVLLQQRDELVERLSQRRAEVGYLDQTLRTLRSQADTLIAQAQSLQEDGGDASAMRAQLAELERRIDDEAAKLDAAKAAQAAEPSSYAIVPYDGPGGTRRRPIFIECTGGAVVLQPEGIKLQPSDFSGPLLPGNPLDAALRAVQEYVESHGGETVHGSPYPLFLVREKGAVGYSVARGSIKSWENEFGYELIPDDMNLAYPPVDPGIKAAMEQAVEDARKRQAALAAAQPSRFTGPSGGGRILRAMPTGGFAPVGGGGIPREAVGNTFGAASLENAVADSTGTSQNDQTRTKNATDEKRKSDVDPTGSVGEGGAASTKPNEQPIAENQGDGWAVPESASSATPLERPIRVAIEADRVVIVAEARSEKGPMQVAFSDRTRDAVGPLVAGVQDRIKSWGFAGRGFYWRPRMIVEVRPGGERRYAELARLLENSGIVLEAASP